MSRHEDNLPPFIVLVSPDWPKEARETVQQLAQSYTNALAALYQARAERDQAMAMLQNQAPDYPPDED